MTTSSTALVSVALVCLVTCTSICHGAPCSNLEGFWYNQLGSEMLLNHSMDGLLMGEYRTAVERRPGTAGTSHSPIIGAAPYDQPGSTFGFSVSWRAGASTTAWTAQCVMCGGDEVILTSWVLRSRVNTCLDRWKSTFIGQDRFTRHEQRVGPRRRFGTHTPQGYNPGGDSSIVKRHAILRSERVKRDVNSQDRPPCTLDGTTWYNLLGSKVTLTEGTDNIITGTYHTPREAHGKKQSGRHSDIHGIGNAESLNNTFAMFLVWGEGQSVTGWVGQCHICDDGNQTVEVLQMTWLHRTRVDSCDANWRATRHGENTFYTQPQTMFEGIEQTEDLIGEFGEESSFDAVTGGAQDQHRDVQFAGLLTACLAMVYHATTIN